MKSDHKTSELFDSVTSSPASAGGALRSGSQAGPTLDLSGQEVVRASPLATLAPLQLEQPTTGTYGRSGFGLSNSPALQRYLESKLRQRLSTGGSTLFTLTWKSLATPLGRVILALRASVPRTSDSASTSWLTPTACSANSLRGNGQDPEVRKARGHAINLQDQVRLASWVTPTNRDYKDCPGMSTSRPDGRSRLDLLPRQAYLAGWGTPTCAEAGGTPEAFLQRKVGKCGVSLTALNLQAHGLTSSLYPAATGKVGQLNPAHSRWLMGYPSAWDDCAPTVTPSSLKLQPPSWQPQD